MTSTRVGIDLVEVDRLARAIERRPGIAARVFTPRELAAAAQRPNRLAARFAAKEAAMKALGVGIGGFALREVEVVRAASGEPAIELHGRARARAAALGVSSLAVSLTHTEHLATAVVVAAP